MSGVGDHRRWRAELAAYLLGSLEAEETEALEGHLDACQRCRDELRWLQPAIDMIGESVPQLEPSPGLRARLMAEVRSDVAEASDPATAEPGRPAGRKAQALGLRGFFWRPAAALTAAALIAAVVTGYALRGGGSAPGTTTTRTVARGGAVHATLESSGDSGTLQLTGLRQARMGHVYQAWVQRNHRIVPLFPFEARENGTASTSIPHLLKGAEMVMVTVEPRGGSRHPTSSPIVTVAPPG